MAKAIWFVLVALGLLMAIDGVVGMTTTTTQQCTQGLCTTTTGTDGTITTLQVTSSYTVFTTTISGTVTTISTTYNPSNVQVTITTNPNIVIVGQSATFTATTSVPLPGATYSWFFGDGTGAVGGPVITHTYASPLSYPVSVLIQNTNSGGSPQNLGSGNIQLTVQCPTTGCILGTPTVLVVTVISSYTGGGLGGATVTVTNSTTGAAVVAPATTNSAGQAAFTSGISPKSTYTVAVSAPGYNGQSQQVTMPDKGGASLSFTLTVNCGKSICPQSLLGGITGGALSGVLEIELGLAIAVAGGVMVIRGKR